MGNTHYRKGTLFIEGALYWDGQVFHAPVLVQDSLVIVP